MSKRKPANRKRGRCCPGVEKALQPRFFKALCDPNRIALLARLARCGRPCSVGEMSSCCPVDMSVISRHLALLRDAGIIKAEKHGKEVYYTVLCSQLVGTLRTMADAIEACCGTEDGRRTTKT